MTQESSKPAIKAEQISHPLEPVLYLPLDAGRSEIRLLFLLPGQPSEPIHCQLRRFSLSDSLPEYETISYCWGDETSRTDVYVNDVKQSVPSSSASALRRMRIAEDDTRLLWIDAICIDQSNVSERSSQVALMRDVYASGIRNLIYLGDEDVTAAVESVRAILADPQAQALLRGPRHNRRQVEFAQSNCIGANYSVEELLKLFSNEWFRRLWIVQEAVLARENLVHCGKSIIRLLELTRAATCLRRNHYFVQSDLERACQAPTQLNELIDRIFGHKDQSLFNRVAYLITVSQKHLATKPHDKVYGILGLLDGMRVSPNYQATVATVFEDATRQIMRLMDDIFCLRYVRHDPDTFTAGSLEMPSWIPTLIRPQDPAKDPLAFRGAANAGGSKRYQLRDWESPPTGSLCVTGVLLGFASSTQLGAHTRPQLVEDALKSTLNLGNGNTEIMATAAETLCAQVSTTEFLLDPSDLLQAYCTYHGCIESGREIPKLSDHGRSTDGPLDLASRYQVAVLRACVNRAFFVTSNGRCGLGPSFMTRGDVAVVLYGFTWPVLLRPVGDNYRYLGLAYVHGIMHGELFPDAQSDTERVSKTRAFRLI